MKKTKQICIFALCLVLVLTLFAFPADTYAKTNTLKKKVTVTYKKTPTGILAVYKNKNKKAVRIRATMHFKDAAKNDISKDTLENLCLGAKATGTLFFPAPRDENGDCINYNSYSCSYSVKKSSYKNAASKIVISSELDIVEGKFVAVNSGKKTLSHIHATAVFYGADGSIRRCFTKELTCYKPGEIFQFSIEYPSDMSKPDKVKVYIDWAY